MIRQFIETRSGSRSRGLVGALALAFAAALSGTARAQEPPAPQGQLRPVDGAPAQPDPLTPAPAPQQAPVQAAPTQPEPQPQVETAPRGQPQPADPGNWKGAAPAAPGAPAAPAANGADPLTQPAAPKDPNVIANDDPRAGKIIDRNYSEAIKTYDRVLQTEGESVENLDHRIQSNEQLVANYKKKLAECNDTKRRMQVELFNRTFYLKQQRDKGAIPDDTYEKMVKQEEKKYTERSSATTSDIAFYEKEIQDAETRLNDLRAQRRVQVTSFKATQMANGKPKTKPMTASQKMLTTLKDRLQAAWPSETKNPMDGAPVCDECLRPGSPAMPGPAAGAPGGDAPVVATAPGGGGS